MLSMIFLQRVLVIFCNIESFSAMDIVSEYDRDILISREAYMVERMVRSLSKRMIETGFFLGSRKRTGAFIYTVHLQKTYHSRHFTL